MKYLYNLFKVSIKRFYHDDYFYHVSALTYVTLLGIVPFFAIILFFSTKLSIFSYFVDSADKYILTTFVPTSAAAINFYFQSFISQALRLPTFNVLFFLVISVMLLTTIQDTFNNIWHVQKKSRSLMQWFFAVIALFVAPIVIGLGTVISTFFISSTWIQSTMNYFKLTSLLILLISVLVNIFILALFYIMIPNTKVQIKHGFIGAIVAASFFEIAKLGFTFYMNSFHNYQLIYGNFAIIPIFLLWIYICWVIILFGGIIAWAVPHSTKLN